MINQTMDNNSNKPQKMTPKEAFVINDDTDFEVFINKIDYFAKKKIPVAVNPYAMDQTTLVSRLQSLNYFATLEYNPNKMTHIILIVLPQMTPLGDIMGEKGFFDGINVGDDVEDSKFEYPEK